MWCRNGSWDANEKRRIPPTRIEMISPREDRQFNRRFRQYRRVSFYPIGLGGRPGPLLGLLKLPECDRHYGRLDVGLGDVAAAQERRNLEGIGAGKLQETCATLGSWAGWRSELV